MGSGASCAERNSTPLDERLRTMLILRAYNCRPRDWTMKDQFDAAAENGVLTKDHLRKALRLGECPRIEALLDRSVLFEPPDVGARQARSAPVAGSISVAALITFVENGSRRPPHVLPRQRDRDRHQQHTSSSSLVDSGDCCPPPWRPPSPLSPRPTSTIPSPSSKPSADEAGRRSSADCAGPLATSGLCRRAMTSAPPECPAATTAMTSPADPDEGHAAVADDVPVDSTGVELLTPRIVPLTSIRALSAAGATAAAAAAEDPNSTNNDASFTTSISRAGRKEEFSRHSSVHPSGGALGDGRAGEEKGERKLEAGGQEDHKKRGGGGPCTSLVRHLGTVLGLRGKEAYRRPGPGKPVWRKRETLIQERIVQYTTLDEEGAVQELFETEKSQTEVLHMECKRTGEFAHRESTHYESGEAFNGEEGVGARESSGRGEFKRTSSRRSPAEGGRQAKSNDSGDSRTSTCPLASGGGGDVVDGLQPGLECQNTSLVQNLEAGGDHLERLLRGDTSADALREAGDYHFGAHRGAPVDLPGLGSECGGSVVFLDNQNRQGEGGREDGGLGGEEGWWQAESGNASNGMEISFEGDNVSVLNVAGEQVNVPDEAKEGTPRSIPSSNIVLGKNSDDVDGGGDGSNHDDDDDDDDENDNLSRLLEGLRSGEEAPPPAATRSEDKGRDGHHGRAPLHVDTISDGFPPPEDNGDRKREPAAPAPFHSHTWGHTAVVAEVAPATADAPCEDVGGGEGKAARADTVGRPGFPGPFSESDAVA
ncbi:unnamed protein product [Ectocarpus sp. 12 AP-2014]